jgi:MATE family multidrug resistance protein
VVLLARRANDGPYRTLRGFGFDGALFRRLLRFGLPSGFHWLLDIAGFSLFLLLVGRLGEIPLAATNLAFNVNGVAFMPMIGIGTAVSVLVGQYLGRNRPDVAAAATWRGFWLASGYMGTIAAAYFFFPGLFIAPFASGGEPGALDETSALAVTLLRFVALYSLFDSMNIIFASAVKGAGDTRFVMWLSAVLSFGLLVVPTWVSLVYLGRGVGTAWVLCTAYVCVLGVCFLLRFLGGKWKSMRVIEAPAGAVP